MCPIPEVHKIHFSSRDLLLCCSERALGDAAQGFIASFSSAVV